MKGVEACVMAGDPEQLPPTVKSARGLEEGLDCTLFARLAGLSKPLADPSVRVILQG